MAEYLSYKEGLRELSLEKRRQRESYQCIRDQCILRDGVMRMGPDSFMVFSGRVRVSEHKIKQR